MIETLFNHILTIFWSSRYYQVSFSRDIWRISTKENTK